MVSRWGRKNPKWLQDDYVKFIRWGQWRIEQSGAGILAFITNHGYLDNPTFRGMREKLLKSFSEIYLLNLHGNAKKRERVPEDVQRALGIGEQDENVFDIQQGVAIGIFVKEPEKSGPAKVFYADLWGVRERKYQWLLEHDVNHTEWEELSSQAPFYLFVPQERARLADHESGWKITEIMPVNSVGIVTSRDDFVFDFDKTALEGRIKDFLNPRKSDQELRNYLRDKDKLDVSKARQEIQKASWSNLVVQCLYRPFDTRYLFYHDAVIERSRRDVMRHMLAGGKSGAMRRPSRTGCRSRRVDTCFLCKAHRGLQHVLSRGQRKHSPLPLPHRV
jgi:predicted helicase